MTRWGSGWFFRGCGGAGVFLFFSSGLGCIGSIIASVVATLLLLLLLNVI